MAEQFPVKQDGFTGITCTWYVGGANNQERELYCGTTNHTKPLTLNDKVLDSSVQIPATLFQQLEDQDIILSHNIQHISVVMYKNNKFFPVNEQRRKKDDVTSAVVGVKLGEFVVCNSTDRAGRFSFEFEKFLRL